MASALCCGFSLSCSIVLVLIFVCLESTFARPDKTWTGAFSEDPHRCPPRDLKCDDGRCIHERWKCDGQRDCRDGSDERDCEAAICTEKQFVCDRIRCIPVEWRCDGQTDCQDGSDESAENCRLTCPSSHFRCATGQCIPHHWKCDGERDCKDGMDEDLETCAKAKSCFKGEKMCANQQECMDISLWCDGKEDCRDGSDEVAQECANVTTTEAPTCWPGQFRCKNGRCISASWVCDGMRDCTESEDEKTADCPLAVTEKAKTGTSAIGSSTSTISSQCSSTGDFTCADGECIPNTWHCDGSPDCADGSDEREWECGRVHGHGRLYVVGATSSCKASEFFCVLWNSTGTCLPLEKVCDNRHHDCLNGTDEGPACLTACKENGQCSDKCHATPLGPVCSCQAGYSLSPDGKACIDIDECAGSSLDGPCSQTCTNTRGSFKCGCVDYFALEKDGVTCKAETDPLLLYGTDRQISWVTPKGDHQGKVTENHHFFVTVGIQYIEGKNETAVFYSDSERQAVYQYDLGSGQERVILSGMGFPEGLALDWMARNLYYTDSGKQEIGVCSIRNRTAHCAKMIQAMSNPRGIAVHPGRRMLFWTQWGNSAKIERSWLDGSGRTDIITEKVIWPNAVALDFIHERIYWIDARLNWIETSTYDGRDRRTVLHMKKAHPFGLTILGDRLYWTDWTTKSVDTAMVNGSKHELLHFVQGRPMGVVAMHGSRQPNGSSSPCDLVVQNPCDHICLARPGNLHTCLCHTGYRLHDGKRCLKILTFDEASAGSGTTHAPPHILDFSDAASAPYCTSSKDCDCADIEGSTPDDVCVCSRSRCVRVHSPREQSSIPVVVSHPQIESSQHFGESGQYSASALAAIICAVILSVIVLVVIVVVVRKYCMSWIDPLDEKGLLEDEYQPRNKKTRRCPSIGGFNNPSYENVPAPTTPSPSSYMVKFYKSRLTHENPVAYPETPASSQDL